MNTIQINGVTIQAPSGSNISINNNKVFVDGREVNQVSGNVININAGDLPISINCDCDVVVEGNVSDGVKAKGNVTCQNVSGGVTSGGEVRCGNVSGGVTSGGDVQCGNVSGGIRKN